MSGAITAGTIATVAGIGAAGSIGGALIGSHAAGKAASAQEEAANRSADLQYKASQDALAFQKQQYADQQKNLAPWLQTGGAALGNLSYRLGLGGQPGQVSPLSNQGLGIPAQAVGPSQAPGGAQGMVAPQTYNGAGGWSPMSPGASVPNTGIQGHAAAIPAQIGSAGGAPTVTPVTGPGQAPPGGLVYADQQRGAPDQSGGFGSLMQPYGPQWQAPTGLTEQNDPGFQARLKLGTDAIQKSAAARGNVLTGGTAKALENYAQDYASNEFNNVYNRSYNDYTTGYNQYQQQQANEFNRLASLAGAGQTTATTLGQLGNQASQGISNNLLNTAQGMGQAYQNAGAANASGIVGAGNAWSGAASGIGGNLSNLMLLKQLYGGGSAMPGTGTLGSTGHGVFDFNPAQGDTTNYNLWNM